jgi:conjugal transfer pilus assembly protein TraU
MGKASLCGPLYANILPKEQFRWQMVFPNNESSSVPNNIPGTGGPTSTASMPTSMAQPTISADQVDTIISPSQTNSALQQIANGSTCTHWTGQSPLTWGEWLGQPGTGGNYVYLVFQWTDCCMGLIGGSLQ